MDDNTAESATDNVSSTGRVARRDVLVRAGVAGLAGVAGALVVGRGALATIDEGGEDGSGERPNVPTEADLVILEQVLGFEIAASELYAAKLAADASGDLATIVGVMAENHQAYAQAIAGDTGLSVKNADDEFFDANVASFTGSDESFFEAAHQLEQTAVATHTAVIADYESSEAVAVTASILVIEARHATVLADLLGVDDYDVLFGNDQTALTLSSSPSS